VTVSCDTCAGHAAPQQARLGTTCRGGSARARLSAARRARYQRGVACGEAPVAIALAAPLKSCGQSAAPREVRGDGALRGAARRSSVARAAGAHPPVRRGRAEGWGCRLCQAAGKKGGAGRGGAGRGAHRRLERRDRDVAGLR